ncbi:hypothetical protein BGZ61DRAFT_463552 [Ilyonectria robusta]|uniref:uncharacterized protein n=1 Tax=Ilyonectria robusta TaxID=1079257 RepID=UPI001E8E7D5D|nr:uncharacterized protein BGZ61DRAFT_463552 [Ilyonectria robusta]KAH8661735.1 hypothetical protein BGZ61DRAFT_463552 [Ilyonectria robusta]
MTEILDSTGAIALYVFYITFDYPMFVKVHNDLLDACIRSKSCKRFVPSEWAGNARDFPRALRFYTQTRLPIRERLNAQTDIEWTILCLGMFMDYVVPLGKTYLKDYGEMVPWNRQKWEAALAGTGNEPVGFTSARDVMKAAVRIAKLPKWENYFFIVGENSTLNKITEKMESFYGRKFNAICYKTPEATEKAMKDHAGDAEKLSILDVDEWLYCGATHIPEPDAQSHKERYFQDITFRKVDELLADSQRMDKV